MNSFTYNKPEQCPYHHKPYKQMVLDDGSYLRITQSVLTGQPLLAVATRTYNHTSAGTTPDFVLLEAPIHNCPFCGAYLAVGKPKKAGNNYA